MAMESINPATGQLVQSFQEMTLEQVLTEVDKTYDAFLSWKGVSYAQRKKFMLNAVKILNQNKNKYSEIMTIEMGKPIKQARAEVEKCAWVCEYYADNIEEILKKEFVNTDASESYVQFDPIGVVLAVMPWNFPFWQVFRFAAPALMAGNAGVLKHSSNVSMCALAIEEVFSEAGFPQNLFKSLLINSSLVPDIIYYDKIRAATLTGSDLAGRKVAEIAGKNLKKTVLELGGSDPFIVLADADITKAAETAVKARTINNGESCIAAKRFIVVEQVADEFERIFVDIAGKLKIGDPKDENNDLGPMAREDLLNDLHDQVEQSISKGAKLLAGGKRLERQGYFYPLTVLSDVKKGMHAYDQETFGPVAAIIRVKDDLEAITIANDSNFGLGASLWTNDLDKAKKMAHLIESGNIFINGMVKSDPRLPFGGVKMSGYGRELASYGIKEFVNIKTVWIA